MANFFIDRPVFAWVIAILIMLVGYMASTQLPISRYPTIAPPTITITAQYPGASATAVEQAVTQVIERQLTGLDGMRYMASSSDSAGVASVRVTFDLGVDPDIAQVQVQNKLASATPLLPQAVQRQGLSVTKGGNSFLMVIALVSPQGSYTAQDLGDYMATHFEDPVGRTLGVGQTQLYGSEYAMRIWLDPQKLEQFGLVPNDVITAIRSQNTQVSAGSLGSEPSVEGQEYTATISLQSLMSTPEEFAELPIHTTESGATVVLGDLARVEIGGEAYDFDTRYNGAVSSGMSVSLAAGANALETANAVKQLMNRLAEDLPPDMELRYPYETTPFVEESLDSVESTLYEAVFLVFIVIFVFLQSLRATFPPMLAIPVVLLGVFAVLSAAGFSINTLTLFAMILALGLLVDDAIVVVENIERVMHETGQSAYAATKQSMREISGALVGIVVVLSAVFVPMAFFPGSTGVIYRQFSITIIAAMVLSLITAMILAPAICARLLKQKETRSDTALSRFGDAFNAGFDRLAEGYSKSVEKVLELRYVFLGIFVVLGLITLYAFSKVPTSFLPEEDQGAIIAFAQLPSDASLQRTSAFLNNVRSDIQASEGELLQGIFTIAGYSFAGRGANQSLMFIGTEDWEQRQNPAQSSFAIAQRISGILGANATGSGIAMTPPAIPELGSISGFDVFLQDRSGLGRDALNNATNQVLTAAGQSSTVIGVRPNEQASKPLFNIEIDYEKAQALGIQPSAITDLMSTALGGTYVNDFIDRGRIKRVMVQGDADTRMTPEDLGRWKIQNSSGDMISLREVVKSEWESATPQLNRFNGLPAVNIQGIAAPGKSSGEAMLEMERLFDTAAGSDFGYAWNGVSAEEREAGGQASLLYALSIVFIFLCLAALYESWTIPIAVLLAAPLGVLGAVIAVELRGLNNDIFFQVGLLTTVGLAAKNAILIIEFANDLVAQGKDISVAAVQAARMRLRPILMTSFAFGMGVLPMALASGAGSGAQNAIGTAVLGGMLFSTALGLFFTPLFYVLIGSMFGKRPAE